MNRERKAGGALMRTLYLWVSELGATSPVQKRKICATVVFAKLNKHCRNCVFLRSPL